jgi:hypothetical protein
MSESPRWWVETCLAAARAAAEAVAANQPVRRPIVTDGVDGFDESAAQEALDRLSHAPVEWQTPAEAASAAFLCAMPPLVDRSHTTAYIACVAAGLGHRYISALEAKSLMYSAQLALAAHRPRQRRHQTTPTPTPARAGVGKRAVRAVARTAGSFVRGVIDGR